MNEPQEILNYFLSLETKEPYFPSEKGIFRA